MCNSHFLLNIAWDCCRRFKLRDGLELANFPRKQAPAVSSGNSTGPKGSSSSVQSSISKRIGNRDAGLQWADLEWLKQMTELPVILKGVLRYDDAKLAVKHGVDAIWVSNHGGRQLDSAPATLSALPEVLTISHHTKTSMKVNQVCSTLLLAGLTACHQ